MIPASLRPSRFRTHWSSLPMNALRRFGSASLSFVVVSASSLALALSIPEPSTGARAASSGSIAESVDLKENGSGERESAATVGLPGLDERQLAGAEAPGLC